MPQKRGQNVANNNAKAQAAQRQAQGAPGGVTQKNDLVGVLFMVISLALFVLLAIPSSAPVAAGVKEFLELSFGIGAVLCPIALLLYALSFFVGGDEPLGGRVALGIVLVCASVLALISIFVPEAPLYPSIVLEADTLRIAGGYVGGGISWVLLNSVGKPVGIVLLCGLAALGVIVCGFSVSGFVARMQAHAEGMREVRESAREQRADMRANVREEQRNAPQRVRVASEATSFIGDRTKTVLTRRGKRKAEPQPAPAVEEAPQTQVITEVAKTRVSTKRAKRLAGKQGQAQMELAGPAHKSQTDATGSSEDQALVVPDFLKHPRGNAKPAQKTKVVKRATKRPKKRLAASSATPKRPGDGQDGYELPPMDMLSSNPNSAGTASSHEELEETMERLQGTLHEFGLQSRVIDYVTGPIVTTFRVEMGEGERVNRIRNLEDDIALTLAAEKVRIFAPIPGTSYVGIEIPNKTRQNVHLGDVLPYASGGPLEVAIGRDSSGNPVIADIAKMPHMLVAGTTGSGKSVMINSMIMSLLMRTTPKQVRLIMIDPKRVEFSCYNGLPHLYVPVVTEPRQAASALQWAVSEMERRLKVFERAGAREIKVYNQMCLSGKFDDQPNPPEPMPYLVVIIDELSDLMIVAGKDVESSIVRIAQLARAAGIHLVIATQRPSANVVTGLIKSNIDNRIALKVSSGIDSRVILDETGAERLLGNGDMLFKYRGLNMRRVLGCYTSDNEINEVVDFIREQAEPDYHEEILSAVVPGQTTAGLRAAGEDDDDPLVWEAAQIVVEMKQGSTSGIQRRLKVGYARAGRIMDMLEAKGVVGPPDGSKPREVLLDEAGLEELRIQESTYREVV
ncbi:MAG: DNA translocase FtsK [Coriobacteriales bacterium]|nr:DNA translocase FtsK [Coriobacteriales bacterium]